MIDYWLSLREKTLSRITGPLSLRAIYSEPLPDSTRITTNNFEYVKLLGSGLSATVFLVRSRHTGHYFALKQIEKSYISDYKKFEQILREKKILTELRDNRHTIRFHCSFESLNHLNFLLDFYPGGELFCHLKGNRMK